MSLGEDALVDADLGEQRAGLLGEGLDDARARRRRPSRRGAGREEAAQRERRGPGVDLGERDVRRRVLGLVVEDGLDLGRRARAGLPANGSPAAALGRDRARAAEAPLAAPSPRPSGRRVRRSPATPDRAPSLDLGSSSVRGLVLGSVRQHLGVARLGGQQLGVRAGGDDPAALEQHDAVGEADGRQPVGDHERGAAGAAGCAARRGSAPRPARRSRWSRRRARGCGGLTSSVRAMAMRWRWPPERS